MTEQKLETRERKKEVQLGGWWHVYVRMLVTYVDSNVSVSVCIYLFSPKYFRHFKHKIKSLIIITVFFYFVPFPKRERKYRNKKISNPCRNFHDYIIVKILRYFTLFLYHAVPSTWYELKNAFIKTGEATVQTLCPNRKQTYYKDKSEVIKLSLISRS